MWREVATQYSKNVAEYNKERMRRTPQQNSQQRDSQALGSWRWRQRLTRCYILLPSDLYVDFAPILWSCDAMLVRARTMPAELRKTPNKKHTTLERHFNTYFLSGEFRYGLLLSASCARDFLHPTNNQRVTHNHQEQRVKGRRAVLHLAVLRRGQIGPEKRKPRQTRGGMEGEMS
jgi:hypothetical protein